MSMLKRRTCRMPGNSNREPIMGKRRRKLIAIGIKPLDNEDSHREADRLRQRAYPKSRKNPYDSTNMPTNGHPTKTQAIPPKKRRVALIFWRWKKKRNVRSKPIIILRPPRKRICEQMRKTEDHRGWMNVLSDWHCQQQADPCRRAGAFPRRWNQHRIWLGQGRSLRWEIRRFLSDVKHKEEPLILLWKSDNWIGILQMNRLVYERLIVETIESEMNGIGIRKWVK